MSAENAQDWRMTRHANGLVKVESADRVIFDGFKGEEANAVLAAAAGRLFAACEQAEFWLRSELETPGQAKPDMILRVLRSAIASATPSPVTKKQ